MQRIQFIDNAKGFGMLLVAWGHIMIGGWTFPFIYSFHMPLFFIMAGMTFDRGRYGCFADFFKKRVKSLLIPYVFYSLTTWGVWAAYNLLTHRECESLWRPLLQTFIAQGSGGFLVHNVPLWFVTCLFVTEIVYFFVDRLPEILNIAVCSVSLIIGYILIEVLGITLLPWSIEVVFVSIFFYAVGNIIAKHVNLHDLQTLVNSKRIIVVVIIACLGILTYFGSQATGHISLGSDLIGKNPFLFVVDALAGSFMTILFCILLTGMETLKLLNRLLGWIGKHSFRIMAVHNPIKGFMIIITARILHTASRTVETSYAYAAVAFAATMAVSAGIVVVINHLPKKIRAFM